MKNGVLLVSLAIAAALVGWLVSPALGAAREDRSISRERDPELLRIREGVEAIAARLTRLESADVGGERGSPPVPDPVRGEHFGRILAAIESLEGRLRDLETRIPSWRRSRPGSPGPELAELLADRPTTEWAAWEEVAELWRVDPSRARRSLLFSTPRDLLARFGEPTRIRGEREGEVCWVYRRPDELGPRLQATVSMLDGYVTGLDLRLP